MKSKEELNALNEELEIESYELAEDKLKQVSGGVIPAIRHTVEDKERALKKAEEELLRKKTDDDTSIMK